MDATDSLPDGPQRSGAWKWGSLAVLAVVVLGYIVVVTAPERGPTGIKGPAIGRSLPYLRLEPLTGDARNVSIEDLKGRVTLLNFWGTWCGPCIREFPHLVDLADHFADQPDFRFYPVSCGGQGNDTDLEPLAHATEAFLQSRKVDLATYADPGASARRALAMLVHTDEFAFPTTMVVDRQGMIRGFWVGYNARFVDEMKATVQALLQEPIAKATGI